MTILIDVDHEAGDLSEYDSAVTDSGDLSAAAGAALAGTGYGLSCLLDDNTAIYGQANLSPPASNQIRLRIYIDPNSLSMGDGDELQFCNVECSGSPWLAISLRLRYVSGTGYRVVTAVYNDAGLLDTNVTTITDAAHYVEAAYVRASGSAAGDGTAQVWIDGSSAESWASIDNYDAFAVISNLKVGAQGVDTNSRGAFYLDELIVNDDGSEIGPVPAAGSPAPAALAAYRRRRS